MKLRFAIASFFILFAVTTQAMAVDTYVETFDSRAGNATIDGTDSWKVITGTAQDVLVQSDVIFGNSGSALKIAGQPTAVNVKRSGPYGGLTPTWIRFKIKPSHSGQTPTVPSSGVAAVCLDYSRKVLANNGSSWIDTGGTYASDKWYDVSLKLDFSNHTYDFYFQDSDDPDAQAAPLKTGLKFIDTSLNVLTALKFSGGYSLTQNGDVYVDDVSVMYIDKFEIISPVQKLQIDQVSSPITVQLQDSLSNPQTAADNFTLELKSTSLRGKFSIQRQPWVDITQIIIPKDSQQATFYYKDSSPGRPMITISEYPDKGFTDATQEEEIYNQVSQFDIETSSPHVAGVGFNIIITAKDEDGNVNENYSGTVVLEANYISPLSGNYNFSPVEISGFMRGKLETVITYPDCGLVSMAVKDKDDPSKTGLSTQILFLPASFVVTADGSQIVSKPFNFEVSARNIANQITPNYNSAVRVYPVAIDPVDITGSMFSPSVVKSGDFKNGIIKVDASYNLYGAIKIRVEDPSDSSKQGLSGQIIFLPKDILIELEKPEGSRNFFYIGEPIKFTVKARDELGNPVVNYPGTVMLKSAYGLTLPSDYKFTNSDHGERKFTSTPIKAGEYTIKVSAEGLNDVESPSITVKNATIQVIDAVATAGSTAEVTIQLVDDEGRVIKTENKLPINVSIIEESANGSVSLPSGTFTLNEGKAIITLSDTEPETVTIIPSSEFKINIKKGTVTFGRIAKSGISTLMWREIKGKK